MCLWGGRGTTPGKTLLNEPPGLLKTGLGLGMKERSPPRPSGAEGQDRMCVSNYLQACGQPCGTPGETGDRAVGKARSPCPQPLPHLLCDDLDRHRELHVGVE